MTAPLVSIVVPTYNRMEFLPTAVHSVFSQTVKGWELLVADDGSARDTHAYLETLAEDERVRFARLPHSGNPGVARNVAIAMARAPLVAFLDSDDWWMPAKLERQLELMRANHDCGWSYTAFRIVDATGTPLASERYRRWIPYDGEIFVETVRAIVSLRVSSVIVRTQLLRDVGGFDETINRSEDYDLWIRLALRSPACVVDEPLTHIRRHAGNANKQPGSAHVARDYSLLKLASQLTGRRRALLLEERSRNALAMAAAIAARGGRWRSVVAISKSLRFSWKYPRWWLGATKGLARVCIDLRRSDRKPTSSVL